MRGADTRCAQQGFTLIEVLAALIIVSLGMLGVIEAVSQTASNGSYLRDKTLAHWVAMNQLTKTRLEPQMPKVDETSDEIEMADRRWRWTMKVTQTPLESVRRIDVSVRLADGNEKSSLASITGFYGTAIAQPGTTLVLWQGSETEQRGGGRNGGQNDGNEGNNPPPRNQPENTPPPQTETPPGEQQPSESNE
ncbi:MAG TPA: type II secretion system minor pseudopilin GspI [Povalibacter sp.]|nr:type II secretion system minor pseudopilin GspI [Povalibacter sp.]